MALTVAACKNAAPKDKPYKLTDERGLYLEVAPGGAKYWRLKYRFAGKEKRLAFGVFPEVGLADARAKRDEARRLLADGQDPAAVKKAQRQAVIRDTTNSFRAVAERWLAVRQQEWAPKHTRTVEQRLAGNILPWLGDKPIHQISTPDVAEVLERAAKRGAIETAHRLAHIIKGVFAYAEAAGVVQTNQIGAITKTLPSRQPKHLAAATTPAELAPMLRAIDGYHGTFVVSCALKLAPLLFCRPGELRHMEWAELDLEAGEWVIPGAKLKGLTVRKSDRDAHLVPLSHQAVEILRQLQPLTGRGRYVFPSARDSKRPMSDNAVLSALRRLGIEKSEMSGHGWRATARTIGAEVLNFRPDLLEAQLAHTVKDANGRAYNRTTFAAERRDMMQRWADFLDSIKTGADVVPLGKGKRA
ncbi:MAG: integrase arm-type DNA-binding domain-containing protein [Gammaproteobacteria bacterium]|nr:integrase arm-type DNA-binding domain-containing protein [Gammaproteobacteria bacterium]